MSEVKYYDPSRDEMSVLTQDTFDKMEVLLRRHAMFAGIVKRLAEFDEAMMREAFNSINNLHDARGSHLSSNPNRASNGVNHGCSG